MTSASDFHMRLRVREALNCLDDALNASDDRQTVLRLRYVTQVLEEILTELAPETLSPDWVESRFNHFQR
jgi:hypothetical protein